MRYLKKYLYPLHNNINNIYSNNDNSNNNTIRI